MATALLVIDVQHDFAAPDGALAVCGAEALLPRIDELLRSGGFDVRIATRDAHPPDHASFVEQGGEWPVHCVEGTPGYELHPGIDQTALDAIVDKGRDRDAPGYSAFETPDLGTLLREEGVTVVTVVGLATDYCVLNSARDALREGFLVSIPRDAVAAVEREDGDGERALEELAALGAAVV